MDYFIPLLSSFIIAFTTIRLCKPIAIRTGLVDSPNARKIHVGEVPLVGGFGIFISILTASMLFIDNSRHLNLYLIASALILFLGTLDDRYDLSVRVRLVSQVIVSSLIIFGTEIHLTSLGNLFGMFEIQLGFIGALVTVVGIIAGINAFNMIDGIDGLAGSTSIITFCSLAYLFADSANELFLLPILFIAALAAYLMFNLGLHRSLSKVFMGDSGNMLIGLTIVWLMVIGVQSEQQYLRPVTALYLIAIPLMDMAAIMIRRVKRGVSPFKADREHLHHIFERAGYSRKQTLCIISLMSVFFAVIGCWSEVEQVPEWIMFFTFLIVFAMYNWALQNIWTILTWLRKKS
ncbi:UDP-N-acetylglucosamine--undecaprenyl-phosphate N-acetylglucosaminephosphotransferase [Shewanella sp. WXL01]|uniref:UDP-N-acetylglucosamine--undecaprenyl-phosphate N-acetylglucosaminephosphotransferase n=1 Tax=Shewanella sp. WXL01 TaxID=2709721 RepID=UPI00143848A7|nr:UDP-N-acetylglucosamine--undecaprenyl-phosphate N-acetylglucosaminephosphotransferase [Shewanella sp. WXL01]NKF50057.1 UDP-N-acetylglucosamine--undecaprenyl-phosphate N-acetylglucosaminephosphotransferase [Shewanella sp. WXL01]